MATRRRSYSNSFRVREIDNNTSVNNNNPNFMDRRRHSIRSDDSSDIDYQPYRTRFHSLDDNNNENDRYRIETPVIADYKPLRRRSISYEIDKPSRSRTVSFEVDHPFRSRNTSNDFGNMIPLRSRAISLEMDNTIRSRTSSINL